jgi:hypothetical protein
VAAQLVRILGKSWRIELHGVREYDRALEAGERCIFAFWHARLFPLVFTHRGRAIAVLVGRHRDGDWSAGIIERMGFRTARGSSTRGGERGIREMLTWGEGGHLLAITPDGPRGPRERVKLGVVYLASRSAFPVVPVATAARRSWIFDSWDQVRVPHPFARVLVGYGAPIAVPPDLGAEAAEAWRLRIEAAITDLTQTLAQAAGEGR